MEKHKSGSQNLKKHLMLAPMLTLLSGTNGHVVCHNASQIGLGYVLIKTYMTTQKAQGKLPNAR